MTDFFLFSLLLNQLQPNTSLIPDSVNYFMLKTNTTYRLRSITVRGIHIWNGLASEITQFATIYENIQVSVIFLVFMNSYHNAKKY